MSVTNTLSPATIENVLDEATRWATVQVDSTDGTLRVDLSVADGEGENYPELANGDNIATITGSPGEAESIINAVISAWDDAAQLTDEEQEAINATREQVEEDLEVRLVRVGEQPVEPDEQAIAPGAAPGLEPSAKLTNMGPLRTPWGVEVTLAGAGPDFGGTCEAGSPEIVWHFAPPDEVERLADQERIGPGQTAGGINTTGFEAKPTSATFNGFHDADMPDEGMLVGMQVCLNEDGEVITPGWSGDWPAFKRNAGYSQDETVAYQLDRTFDITGNEPSLDEALAPVTAFVEGSGDGDGSDGRDTNTDMEMNESMEMDLGTDDGSGNGDRGSEPAETDAGDDLTEFEEEVMEETEKAINREFVRASITESEIENAISNWPIDEYTEFFGACTKAGNDATRCGALWTEIKARKENESAEPKTDGGAVVETPPPDEQPGGGELTETYEPWQTVVLTQPNCPSCEQFLQKDDIQEALASGDLTQLEKGHPDWFTIVDQVGENVTPILGTYNPTEERFKPVQPAG